MASALPPADIFYGRILSYARATGLAFKKTRCHGNWSLLGLPDMRGFTPHLRTIRLAKDDEWKSFSKNKRPTGRQLWLIHDFLHILFYDFASLHLGRDLWCDPARFLECHLASEAFAVLALDYHVAPGSVASSYNLKDWRGFQKEHPMLPSPSSWELCQGLTQYYLGTPNEIIDPSLMKRPPKSTIQKRFQIWLGHELRYASKQLYYTSAWLQDLSAASKAAPARRVESSVVAGPLWDLLAMVTKEEEAALWKGFTEEVSRSISGRENYFAAQPKFKRNLRRHDFRFTGMKSFTPEEIKVLVEAAKIPESSGLFLFWQILTEYDPSDFSKNDRSKIKALAHASGRSGKPVPLALWKHVRHICLDLLSGLQWKPDPLEKAVFFLP